VLGAPDLKGSFTIARIVFNSIKKRAPISIHDHIAFALAQGLVLSQPASAERQADIQARPALRPSQAFVDIPGLGSPPHDNHLAAAPSSRTLACLRRPRLAGMERGYG
jgi:hypothetical protein